MKHMCSLSRFEKGTVVISIDDGNADDFRLYENILSKYGLPATFNIISGKIGKEGSLTVEQLRTIYNDPAMEIAAHGYAHQNDDEDVRRGIAELYGWLGISEPRIGFASPGSQMKNAYIKQNRDHLQELGLLYVRTAGNPEASPKHEALQRKLKSAGASDYVVRNVPQLTYSFEDMCVNSVVVYHRTELADLKALIDLAAEERACIVLMFHRTKKKGEWNYDEEWCYDYDCFEELAAYLDQRRGEGRIDVLTTRQAFCVGYARG